MPRNLKLAGLSARAFAGVREARAAALDKLTEQIAAARVTALRDVASRFSRTPGAA